MCSLGLSGGFRSLISCFSHQPGLVEFLDVFPGDCVIVASLEGPQGIFNPGSLS